MRLALQACAWTLLPLGIASAARAQDMVEVQRTVEQTLFAARDRQAVQQAEQRRLDQAAAQAVEERAQAQAALLERQAADVQALRAEVQTLHDERQILALAEAFEAALAARDWSLARTFLADAVAVDLPGMAVPGPQTIAADALIATWTAAAPSSATTPLLRTNQRVTTEADRAVLTASGTSWNWLTRRMPSLSQRAGEYEYRLGRTAEGWKIDGLSLPPRSVGLRP